jgi:hypothetical protein
LRYSQDWEYEARAGALRAKLARVDDVVALTRQHPETRVTTGGRWLDPESQVHFFTTLYASAVAAGVGCDALEMQHFSRWVFSASRQVAMLNHKPASSALFNIAVKASGGLTAELLAYRVLSGMIGWHQAARFVERIRQRIGREPGLKTRRQSWMENDSVSEEKRGHSL